MKVVFQLLFVIQRVNMVAKYLLALLIVCCVGLSLQASNLTSPYYTAGVVEFKQASGLLTPAQRLDNNLKAYLEIITSNDAIETDIIIFPEGTLNNVLLLTYVPDPVDKIAPCNQLEYADFLQELSCQAKLSKKYLVVNLSEKETCTAESQAAKNDPRSCAPYGWNSYNTNVVFDRNGVVISRYRKYNLYYEPWNITYTPELGYFDTDFGVRFGHFICFDMLFYKPTSELVKMGITDLIFPTMWFSELPFLTAVQYQQSWAYSYDVNLLAAGASNPSSGSTGSGIYAGKNGVLVSVMSSEAERKLYVSKVYKKGFIQETEQPSKQLQIRKRRATTSTMKGLLVKRDSRIDAFNTMPLDPSVTESDLCHEGLCCHFNYKVTKLTPIVNSKSYQYRLVAFNGDRIYPGIEPLGWAACSIMACINNTMSGCALSFGEDVTVSPELRFESISIEADFYKSENVLLMPNSVDEDLMPLPVDNFKFEVQDKGGRKNARIQLLTQKYDLINFGIYVNYFREERSLATSVVVSKVLVALSLAYTFVLFLRK